MKNVIHSLHCTCTGGRGLERRSMTECAELVTGVLDPLLLSPLIINDPRLPCTNELRNYARVFQCPLRFHRSCSASSSLMCVLARHPPPSSCLLCFKSPPLAFSPSSSHFCLIGSKHQHLQPCSVVTEALANCQRHYGHTRSTFPDSSPRS